MVRFGLRLCSLLFATLAVAAAVQPATPPMDRPSFAIRAVVRTGQPAPGGGLFTEFSDPALNERGSLAFAALTSGQGPHAAVYLRVNERISILAASGQGAPTGGVFRVFNDIVLSDRDTVLFLGRTSDRIAHQGLYLARKGTVVPVVSTGQPAPGGGTFTDFANPTINARDVVAFVGRIGQGEREGIFTSTEGSIIPAALSGQPSPTGGVFQFFVDGSPAMNDRGEIAFIAAIAPRGTFGVFVLVGGRPIPVVTTEDEAPVGGAFTEFGSLMLTNPGTVGFVGRTAHSAVREGLYVTGRAALVLLAQQGQAVANEVLTSIVTSAMNDGESVVFELGRPDPISRAVFLATRAGVRAVVRAGDQAPLGRRFVAFGSAAINDRGQIAFVAQTDDQQHAIYLLTPR
jgi:hypothetical protein